MLRSGSVLLGDDHSQQIDAADVEPLVLGWESVIASGAAVAQAVEFVVGTGLTLFVKAEPTEGGTLLDLLLRESEHLAPPEVDRLLTNSTINAKTALTPQRAVGIVERPRMAFASFAGSAVLPPGKALLLPVALETVTGGVHYVVDLRITGKVRPAHASFLMAGRDDPDAPSRVDLFHLGHWSTEGVRCAGISASTLGPDMYLEEEETLVSSYLEPLGLDLLADFVRGALPEFQDRESYSLWNRNSQLWAVSSPDVADRILRMCNSVAPPLTTFEVSGRIRVGDREVGRFQLPLLSRRPAALWSGVQSMALDSWSIEVAQDASTAYPSFRALLDGFALSLEPAPAPDGSAWLRVKAKLNFLREPPRMLDLETDDNRRITKSRTRSVFVEDSVQTDPEGSSRFVFGSDPSLELEVRARR